MGVVPWHYPHISWMDKTLRGMRLFISQCTLLSGVSCQQALLPPPKKKKTHRVVSSNHWRGEARGNRPTILPLNSRIVIASMASRSLYTLWSCLRSCAALLCWQIGCGSRIPGRLAGCKGHIWFLGFAYQGSPNMVHSDHLYDQWTGHGGVSVSWNHSQGFHQGHSALCLWPPT